MKLPIPISDLDHARGAEEPLVTVVKYGDYECPDCNRMHRVLLKTSRLLTDTASVRYVYRHFPLISVHPHALRAAEAAEAASAQGRFWEMHDLLFANPDRLTDKDLRKYAEKIGLDLNRYDSEMTSSLYASKILDERQRSINNGISGTPTFFINDELFAGSAEAVIDRVKSLLADGGVRGAGKAADNKHASA